MFTGLVESIGRIVALEEKGSGMRMVVRAPEVLSDCKEGDSIAVSGVCLTALDVGPEYFSADLAPETVSRTSLKLLRVGSGVNLERALLASARLGGHVMQGHVDGLAVISEIRALGNENWFVGLQLPEELERYVVFKGSIALDGISLTVAQVEKDKIGVAIIPHTWAHTTLRERQVGDVVNVEVDVMAKYVEKLLAFAK